MNYKRGLLLSLLIVSSGLLFYFNDSFTGHTVSSCTDTDFVDDPNVFGVLNVNGIEKRDACLINGTNRFLMQYSCNNNDARGYSVSILSCPNCRFGLCDINEVEPFDVLSLQNEFSDVAVEGFRRPVVSELDSFQKTVFDNDEGLLFSCDLKDSLRCSNELSFRSNQIHFVDNGLKINTNDLVFIDSLDFLNRPEGAFEFWYKPDVGDLSGDLFSIVDSDSYEFLKLNYKGPRQFVEDDAVGPRLSMSFRSRVNNIRTVFEEPLVLEPEKFHLISFSWKKSSDNVPDEYHLYVDGREVLQKTSFELNSVDVTDQRESLAKLSVDFNNKFLMGSLPGIYSRFRTYNFMKNKFCYFCDDYPTDDFFVYLKPNFGEGGEYNLVFPSTQPKPEEIVNELNLNVTSGEYEPISFVIYANNGDLDNVEVEITDLVYGNSVIPSSNIDVRVVKVWNQAGFGIRSWAGFKGGISKLKWNEFGVFNKQGVLVPELLVYNDKEQLEGRYSNGEYIDGIFYPVGSYIPPRISLDLSTDILFRNSKQFLVTVFVPREMRSGLYRGFLEINADNLEKKSFNFNVNILPFELDLLDKDLMIFYKGRLKESEAHFYVPDQRMIQELNDIKNHGLNGIYIDAEGTDAEKGGIISRETRDALSQKLALISSVGFRNVIQTCITTRCSDVSFQKSLLDRNGFDSYIFYGPDEAIYYPGDDFSSLLSYIKNLHDQDSEIALTTIYDTAQRYGNYNDEMYENVVDDLKGIKPDITILVIPPKPNKGYPRDEWKRYYKPIINNEIRPRSDVEDYYYWQLSEQMPRQVRFLSGYFLYLTKFEGIMPYAYQHISIEGTYTNNPYNDFDSELLEKGYIHDQMVVYPSLNAGPIPTLEWEALREGIDDLRYITTLENRLNLIKNSRPQDYNRIKSELDLRLVPFKDLFSWKFLSDKDFQDLRNFVIEMILEIDRLNSNI